MSLFGGPRDDRLESNVSKPPNDHTTWLALLVRRGFWSQRRAVLVEFLELARDVLGFLALLLLAVTLVRLPKARRR